MEEPKIIKGVIDCTKITKSRLFTKEGKTGKYLRIVLIKKKEKDRYGQTCYMVKEDITKEERENGIEGKFIGDASAMKPNGTSAPPPQRQNSQPNRDDDVPF